MSTEDRLTAVEANQQAITGSLQDVTEAVRVLNDHQRLMQETFRESFERLVQHQLETDEVVNRVLRHIMLQSENGNQQ